MESLLAIRLAKSSSASLFVRLFHHRSTDWLFSPVVSCSIPLSNQRNFFCELHAQLELQCSWPSCVEPNEFGTSSGWRTCANAVHRASEKRSREHRNMRPEDLRQKRKGAATHAVRSQVMVDAKGISFHPDDDEVSDLVRDLILSLA